MIVVKLMDGLGNQMFQYAMARGLQARDQDTLVIETAKCGTKHSRALGLNQLVLCNNNVRFANAYENLIYSITSKGIRLCTNKILGMEHRGEQDFSKMTSIGCYMTLDSAKYYELQKSKMPIKFIYGWFQTAKYFNHISDEIKQELRVKKKLDREQEMMIEEMNSVNSVALHIRRGDYIGLTKFEVCTKEYYNQAIKRMNAEIVNPVYYVFSNNKEELEYIRLHYNLSATHIVYVDIGEDEFDDLRLMYNCKHHIISNSTYSWWGSYLCANEENVTIAPSRWMNTDEDLKDIYMQNWILLDC